MNVTHMWLEHHAVIFCRFHDLFITSNVAWHCEKVLCDIDVVGKHWVMSHGYVIAPINLRVYVEILNSIPV